MNFWKQSNHVMTYFQEENFRGDKRLPSDFMSGFLQVRSTCLSLGVNSANNLSARVATDNGYQRALFFKYQISIP